MTKKAFMEPECDIVRFSVEDILTTSSDDWLIVEITEPVS